MNVETLHDLFVSELRRAYAIETALVEELDTLAADADVDALDDLQTGDVRDALRRAIEDHLEETRTHVDRLEEAFDALGMAPERRATPALDGLVREKELFNNVVLSDELRPLFYLRTGRQIEQLEIAAYEQLLQLGERLDASGEVLDLLRQNLEEEEATLQTLEDISEDDDVESMLEELAAAGE